MNDSQKTRIMKLEKQPTFQEKEYCSCICHEKKLGDFMEITDEYAERVWEIIEEFGSYQLEDGTWKSRGDDLLERIANRPKCTCKCKH